MFISQHGSNPRKLNTALGHSRSRDKRMQCCEQRIDCVECVPTHSAQHTVGMCAKHCADDKKAAAVTHVNRTSLPGSTNLITACNSRSVACVSGHMHHLFMR
jgi:hypothetical protein